jgi:hypothetical protein
MLKALEVSWMYAAIGLMYAKQSISSEHPARCRGGAGGLAIARAKAESELKTRGSPVKNTEPESSSMAAKSPGTIAPRRSAPCSSASCHCSGAASHAAHK